MTDTTLNELKEIVLELLTLFLTICKAENLKYYLLGGSCLGAIRHKGFIPWDDDIDVGLPRPDYDRFIDCAQEYLPDNYFLQTYKTDPGYLQNFAKIRNSNTTFLESSCRKLKINHGIYLDVFPLDGAGINEEIGKNQLKKIRWYTKPIGNNFCLVKSANTYLNKTKKQIRKILYPVIFPNVSQCLEIRDKLFREFRYENSEYVANYGGAWGAREIVPKHFFGDGYLAEFEGIEVVIPEKYHDYLTHVYGDYMTPPPIDKRVAHHYCEVIDTKKSYKEYV